MSNKAKKRIQGSISLLMVIILLPMMTLSALLVDTARYNLAKSMISSAGDLALNSALANYDTILKDVYGLFALSQNEAEWTKNVQKYFEDTLVSYGVVSEADAGDYLDNLLGDISEYLIADGKKPVNFLDMQVGLGSFSAKPVADSALSNPNILKKQIVEYMKYRAPVSFGMSFLDSVKSFSKVSKQATVVEKQLAAQQSTDAVTKACKAWHDSILVYDKDYSGESFTGASYKNVVITEYPKILNSFKQGPTIHGQAENNHYAAINKLLLVFFTAAFNGTPQKLKANGDYIVRLGNDKYDLPNLFKNETTLTDLSYALSEVNRLYNDELMKQNGVHLQRKASYLGKSFFSPNQINGNAFLSEDTAARQFHDYDKFLRNNDTVKYSDMIDTWNTINKYKSNMNNYLNLKQQEINRLENEKNNKTATRNTKQAERDTITQTINSNSVTIQNNIITIQNKEQEISNFDFFVKIKYNSLLAARNALKTAQDRLSVSNTEANRKNRDECQVRVNELTDELKDVEPQYSDVGNIIKLDEDINRLRIQNETKEREIETLRPKLVPLDSEIGELDREIGRLQNVITTAKNDKEEQETKLNNVLREYQEVTKRYQTDLNAYMSYQTCAGDMITTKVSDIAKRYTETKTHLEQTKADLQTVVNNGTATVDAIKEYLRKVDAWKDANNAYSNGNGGADSFSKTNAADIDGAKNVYDIPKAEELKKHAQDRLDEVTALLNFMNQNGNFTYGSKKLNNIKTLQDAKDAVNLSGKKDQIYNDAGNIITTHAIWFSQLYSNSIAPEMNTEIVSPMFALDGEQAMACCIFGYYLTSMFRENQEASITVTNADGSKTKTPVTESQYNDVKDSSNDKNGKAITDTTDTTTYGYTYKGKSITSSAGESEYKENAGIQTSTKKDDRKNDETNASAGFNSQKGLVDTLLGGIGSALEASRDNLFVLQYIFDNFSYNTLVQSAAVKANGAAKLTDINFDYDSFKHTGSKAPYTTSGIAIKPANNYAYGAEIEYILFGKESASTNVNIAKGSIFAIRFVFNCIFAFTDSEIRNITRAAGLAVQAATLGVVPYQVVQIVLQLALAMGESGLDLMMMDKGNSVAVIKSKATWTLSGSGAKNLLVEAAKDAVKDVVESGVDAVASRISGGIQNIIDSSAENLVDSVAGLTKDIQEATTAKADEIISSVFAAVEAELGKQLDKLAFMDDINVNTDEKIASAFNAVRGSLNNITRQYSDTVGKEIISTVREQIEIQLTGIETEMRNAVARTGSDNIKNEIYMRINEVKKSFSQTVEDQINEMKGFIDGNIGDIVGNITDDLTRMADRKTEEAKEEIIAKANDFIEKTFDDIGDKIPINSLPGTSGAGSTTATSTTIKFGYKDYLMLFTFIGLTTNPDSILKRTSDVMQINIRKAVTNTDLIKNSDLVHKKGDAFRMSNACTYISIAATVELKVMFLNLDLFKGQIDSYNEDIEFINESMDDNGKRDLIDLSKTQKITYKSVAGY